MAVGDITFLNVAGGSEDGARKIPVAVNSTINPGEPVTVTLGAGWSGVAALTGTPLVASANVAGIASSKPSATNPNSALWTIDVVPVKDGLVCIASALSAAAVATQAQYDALVGKRVLLDLTTGVYTVATATADAAANGITIVDIDVAQYPGKVAFTIKAGCSAF